MFKLDIRLHIAKTSLSLVCKKDFNVSAGYELLSDCKEA